jgi:hypothetical protein
MPALKPTDFLGEIVWLGLVPAGGELASVPRETLTLTLDGPEGVAHAGRTRPSCSRVLKQHPRGTEIANTRQLSILSEEEMGDTAAAMGLTRLAPEWVGATVVLRGLPDLTFLPPSSRLQAPDGATLVVDMENRACVLPGKVIEDHHPGYGAAYKPAGKDRRGITAWVERPGTLRLGETLRLHIPDQRAWKHLSEA